MGGLEVYRYIGLRTSPKHGPRRDFSLIRARLTSNQISNVWKNVFSQKSQEGGFMPLEKKICLAVLILTLVFSSTALSQETTGGIQGTVKDAQGGVIPGAAVEVTSPALIGKKTAMTDSGGVYRFDLLPPGVYSITVNATGFAPQTQNNLQLSTGALPTINFTVQLGAITQEVSVSAEAPALDVTLSKVQTNVTQDVLLAIPKLRSFQSVIPFAPGARQEPLQGARESRLNGFQIDGATDSENVYLIDGVNATAPVGGVAKDFQSDFVEEVQVKSGGFEAEFGGALGGVINAVPKRGSNSWHGELKTYFQTSSLDANDQCGSGYTSSLDPRFFKAFSIQSGFVGLTCGLRTDPSTALNTNLGVRLDARAETFIPKKDSRHTIEPGYEIGGPIKTDRLWIYSSYIPSLDTIQREVNFKCPSSNPTCTFAGPRRMSQTSNQHNATNKLDLAVNDKLRLNSFWNYGYARVTGALPSPDSAMGQINSGATVDPNTFRSDQGVVTPLSLFNTGGDWTPTSKLLVTGRFGYFYSNFATRGTPSGIRYDYQTPGLSAATRDVNNNPFPSNAPFNTTGFSNIPSNFGTQYDIFKRQSFNGDLSYFANWKGSHAFKFGYSWQRQRNDVSKTANTAVVSLFWGQAYQPVTSTTACDAIRATNANGACQGQYGYFHVGSTTVSNSGFSSAKAQSFYLQDSWTVGTSGLSLSLGLRFDDETVPPFDPVRFPTLHFGWGDKIAPRLGAAYDVLHNGKVKAYASWGKFYDITKMDLPRGSFGSDYWHECFYALDTIDFFSITPTLTTGAGCPASGPAPGVNARFIENLNLRETKADPRDPAIQQKDLQSVQSHELTSGVDWAITPNLVLETRFTHKRLDNTIEDMSITDNLGFYIGNPGSAFADILHRPVSINVNGVPTLLTTPFCAECPAVVKANRRYDAVEFRISRRGAGRLFVSGSYTYEKLRGNYAGLTDTDPTDGNGGRHNPNHGRAFDIPTMPYLPSGKPDDGSLATSRPHTGKIWGSYRLRWFGQESLIGLSQALYQGTPISSCLPVVGTSSACQWAEGRGNFALLSRASDGTIVKNGVIKDARTDPLLQTDLSIRHEIRVNKNNENQKLVIEGNGYNMFNQHAGTSIYQFVIPTNVINPTRAARFPGDPGTDWGKLMNGYDYVAALNGTSAFSGVQNPLTLADRYGKPQTYQIARQFRFALRFIF
jgi:hypothetical protein